MMYPQGCVNGGLIALHGPQLLDWKPSPVNIATASVAEMGHSNYPGGFWLSILPGYVGSGVRRKMSNFQKPSYSLIAYKTLVYRLYI